jgi:hypothetical protein
MRKTLKVIGMKYLNVYTSKGRITAPVNGVYVRFENLGINKKPDRRALLQSIANRLCEKGYDASVAPRELSESFDIALIRISRREASKALAGYSKLGPRLVETNKLGEGVINSAWQNRVRADLTGKGFLKIGDKYVLEKDVRDTSTVYKRSFRIQSKVLNGCPSLYVDPRTRIMLPLKAGQINRAEEAGDESDVKVRVLPSWQRGILVGRSGFKAGEKDVPLGNRMVEIPRYWKLRHGIKVKPEEEMLEVYIPAYERTLSYPSSCVFSEFPRGMSLPEDLKKDPETRVKEARDFIRRYIPRAYFAGETFALQGPTSIRELGYMEHSFPLQSRLRVIVGGYNASTIGSLHGSLRRYGPYAGKIDGKYIVIHPGDCKAIEEALKSIEKAYSNLGLGRLEVYPRIGEGGFIGTGGDYVTDYTSTITELRSDLDLVRAMLLALVVLPEAHASEVYYKAREKLFERFFGSSPVPTQAISMGTVEAILGRGEGAYPIAVNMASQCYVKLGGTGSAVWVLDEAADSAIPGIKPGSSCYAYHDVSRRPRMKASATAYSAMTDSYGRYIATGTKPVGGERLTPNVFHDILVELLEKISAFSQRYREMDRSRRLRFKRLVFAKDGVIRRDEAEMMEEVITEGIPEEGRQPIEDMLRRTPLLPDDLVIDIIGVNKSPNKRILDFEGRYKNVREGTAVSYDDSEGLLVSFHATMGTAQPIEIKLHKHICLNREDVPRPHISQIMDEYYRLTYLDWASVFRQGKYALPQILTQNLGENISAGVMVPEDMILL